MVQAFRAEWCPFRPSDRCPSCCPGSGWWCEG